MKQAEDKKGPRLLNLALAIAAVAALGLAGVVWWLKARADEMRSKLETAIGQYDKMKDLKSRIQRLLEKVPKGPQEEVDAAAITTFLSAKAGQAGLPSPTLRVSTPPRSGAWSEIATRVELRGAKDQRIPRGPAIEFLVTVERERPYLKSKNLTLNFADNDLTLVAADISYFKRE